jgi:hypothetical protein
VRKGATWFVFASALGMLSNPTPAQELKLLSASTAEQQIRELHARLDGIALSEKERDASFSQVQAKISEFIIAQLEAEPRLEPRHLRDELLTMFGTRNQSITGTQRDSRTGPDREDPFIQRWPQSWGPLESGSIIWGVTYSDPHHLGLMGDRIMVESYVVNQGKAHLAGRGGSELDGVSMQADRMFNLKPALAVLIHGVVEWSSGHALPCKAALYSIDDTGVHLTWKINTASLKILPDPNGEAFTLMYHDEKRHQSTGEFSLTSVVEVYVIVPGGLKQIISQRY